MKTMTMIGNAHIDPVWLWQWREGYHEVKATFRSALDRMNETPEFVFTCACADYYRWVEENDPEMFEEIRARIREGRWVVVGGMWIQPDMNAPSGESFVRQLMYSQRYFYEKFGLIATVGYNVDSFGHNATIPQMLRRAGMTDYVWMRPMMNENADIPEGPMLWESPDGSRVFAFRIAEAYTCGHEVPKRIEQLFELSAKIGHPVMCFYGVGNHGGGPTIENLREIRQYMDEDPKGGEVEYGSPVSYFAQLRESNEALPVWVGELQHHASGCYSTHSRSKHLHRGAENALIRMETLAAMAKKLTGHDLKKPFVRQAWNNLMFNEFHDIMGGCCLREALEDAEVQMHESISIAQREENAALQRMSWKVDTIKGLPNLVRSKETDWKLWGIPGQGTPVVVFNPHAFEAEGTVLVRRPIRAVRDDDGHPVPAQVIRATRTNGEDKWDGIFRAKVPALGYRLYWIFLEEVDAYENKLTASETVLENAHIRAEFDAQTGALAHLIDKKSGRDALTAPAQVRLMDIEHADTWAHNLFKFDKEAGAFEGAQIKLVENGPVRAAIRVISRHDASKIEQKFVLYADADQLEVEVKLDLHEQFRMVKLCFPTDGVRDVSEIPYGVLERRHNGDEEHCQRWVAMQGEASGLAVLNDGKYSYSAVDGELRMTIANTSLYADHFGQTQRDDTCEFMDQGEQRFAYALVPYAGDWRGAKLGRRAAVLNMPLPSVVETYHEGPLGGEFCGVSVDSETVDVGVLKRAEDENGFVLRMVETSGAAQKVRVDLKLLGRNLELDFGKCEIKTIYLPDDPNAQPREMLLTELEG